MFSRLSYLGLSASKPIFLASLAGLATSPWWSTPIEAKGRLALPFDDPLDKIKEAYARNRHKFPEMDHLELASTLSSSQSLYSVLTTSDEEVILHWVEETDFSGLPLEWWVDSMHDMEILLVVAWGAAKGRAERYGQTCTAESIPIPLSTLRATMDSVKRRPSYAVLAKERKEEAKTLGEANQRWLEFWAKP